jgi:squalene-hopene/tetraprenyl-beta-curcumene cyclase
MTTSGMPVSADIAGEPPELDRAIASARDALLARQQPDGHWVFELEADVTIPAEYVLLRHYLGEPVDAALEAKIAAYLRRRQGGHDGWALFQDGDFDMSASVKAYFALKMIGDAPEADHMRRAREAILARGGAARVNVFTRFMLALFDFIPWRALPMMPIEIMLLPKWSPFHLDKISYWSRTVIVPLLVLQAKKPKARNRKGVRIDELFIEPPATLGPIPKAPQQKAGWFWFFRGVDNVLRFLEPVLLKRLPSHRRAIDRAVAWVSERLNGEDGLGAIFPAMANSVMMFATLGYPESHPQRAIARKSIEKLLVVHEREAYCQPCVSPIWDTGLVCHALLETGGERVTAQVKKGLDWLAPKQVLDVRGDWIARRPDVRPGGWAFQYANAHYPDVDDTAVVAMAMDRAEAAGLSRRFDGAIARAREWILGMQSRNGAWGAFDADNEYLYLNNIPFADHGALLDPPTEDVTARCLSMLTQLGDTKSDAVKAAIDYLRRAQLKDGSWYGRWGMNYIYGTWSVLCALNAAGLNRQSPEMRKAADWLISIQNADGGWGEDGTSYKLDYRGYEPAPSTASQTAWALLGLMASGDTERPAVARGIAYLLRRQGGDGFWDESRYTATGFPRVFYLRYHGYAKFFPLWALARYRNLKGSNGSVSWGM